MKKAYLIKWPYLNFSEGGTLSISSKIKTLLFGLLFDEIRLEIMFADNLVTNRDLRDYKKGLFPQVAILEFFQKGDPIN